MSLFENFPYTNLHELNLDWLINAIKDLQENMVISVNGQTGEVILYQDATVSFKNKNDRTENAPSSGMTAGHLTLFPQINSCFVGLGSEAVILNCGVLIV